MSARPGLSDSDSELPSNSSPAAPTGKKPHVPYSSRNCMRIKLAGLALQREIEFSKDIRGPTRTELKKGTKPDAEIFQNEVNSVIGRAHQEEAAMIYCYGDEAAAGKACAKCEKGDGKFQKCVSFGNIHHGCCANCVFQSATNDCTLAQDSIAKAAADRLKVKETKELSRKARGKGSSKTRKLQTPASHVEPPSDDGGDEDEENPMRTIDAANVLGAVTGDRGGKKRRGGAARGAKKGGEAAGAEKKGRVSQRGGGAPRRSSRTA